MSVSQLFLTTVLFSRFHLSLQLYLSSLPSVSLLSPAPSHNWKQTRGLGLHCGQENEDHTGAMNCSTVLLPLLLLVGHGNLTNNMNDWRDWGGGGTEEDRKWRTGSRVHKEREMQRLRGDCGQAVEAVE